MPFWCDIEHDPNSSELWVDFNQLWTDLKYKNTSKNELWAPKLDKALIDSSKNIVLFDWYHGWDRIKDEHIAWVQKIAAKKPLTWITLNPKSIPGVKTIHFDYYWNRSKRAFLDKQLYHKTFGVENYEQYPVHTRLRQKKYLTYQSRSESYREILRYHLITKYDGFYNDPENNKWLLPNVPNSGEYSPDAVAPPGRMYYDESYVTCLIETQYLGHRSHLVSEKTYDNLIQGRGVLNFATPGFYQHLVSGGWKLPTGVDWSWDILPNERDRLAGYLSEVNKLMGLSIEELHEWFLSNMDCWRHNQEMLKTKPYDIINLDLIKT